MSVHYSELARHLGRSASRAVLGLQGHRSRHLREYLRQLYERVPGEWGGFLADPVFEATFGWKQADVSLKQLSGELLHPSLVKALARPPRQLAEEYAFPDDRRPYTHQLQAWRALIEAEPPRSVLVSSGTGSGKTECFLIPILNDLATEVAERDARLTGVRALFLYPLNALIKSQKDRLVAWSEPFGGRIRWCLYNGDTPENSPPRRQRPYESEVMGRDVLRADPPPILVTNATMLEYMLVRNLDRPIVAQSQGKLRWIVIDEAHSYLGSQAAELTLLLRRVLLAFGCQPDEVHFVATSATIGNGDRERADLQRFLSDIAGLDASRVSVVTGKRHVPPLPEVFELRRQPVPKLERLQSMDAQTRFEAMASSPLLRWLRGKLSSGAVRLSELSDRLGKDSDYRTRQEVLALLDACTAAIREFGEPFLPLRGHLFQRGQPGLWCCANGQCSGRSGTALDTPEWPFGAVFIEWRETCSHCGYPVFDLLQCNQCGQEVLGAEMVVDGNGEWLCAQKIQQQEDEFLLDLDFPDDIGEPEGEGEESEPGRGLKRLVVAGDQTSSTEWLDPDGRLGDGRDGAIRIGVEIPEEGDRLRCPTCGALEGKGTGATFFRPFRVGAPFLLQTAIPELLRHLPPAPASPGDRPMPFGGRRLLAFTDSRQGTARIAARLQQESERNYVRSLLYHRLAQLGGQRDEQRITQLRDEIAALEGPAQANGMLRSMLEGKRNELQAALTAGPGRLPWGDALNYLLAQQGFTQLAIPPLEELTLGQLSERELAALCLWREFMFRPRRQFSLEGLGLACLEYQGLARVSEAPAVLRHHGTNVDEWRDLLRIVLDVQVRGWMAVNIPRDTLRWTGYPGLPRVIVPPGRDKVSRNQQAWPNLQTSMGLRSRLVRLIAYSLRLNPEDLGDRDQIEEILLEIWGALKKVLSVGEDGYCYLDLPKQVELSGVKTAWFCPVTRRLLPAVFRGITPYLPADSSEDLARCVPVEMPALPEPFWNGDRKAAEAWLETDDRVAELRHIGAWSDINDRIATFADYFRAVEHSAQIDGSLLTRREKAFKEGRINLLSCSTTMEMGVDIGGLAAVAMNNVPPHPANFLQRAGRAGRRGETRALSFTLCKSDPQGEAVFANPLWAFTTPLALPGVSMQSRRIVQRHVNSLLLTRFLGQYTDQEAFRLNCGWFFLIPDEQRRSSPAHQFQAWCRRDALNEGLEESMKSLVHGSSLAGVQTQQLLEEAALAAERIEAAWAEEHEALQTNLAEVRTPAGNSKPETAIRLQMQRLEDEYLLSELATRGFLPGYGFPTGVVSLLTTTMSTLKRGLRQREDNRAITRGVPSRPIWQALRDYAPGTDTTLDGRVYRSAGVTLNWHLPVHLEAGQEIQGFSWVWGCNRCGGTGTRAYRPEQCPHCGEADGEKLVRREFLQPAGFAVDIRSRPHNNVNLQQYLPVCDPLISVQGASWMALPDPALGRYRHSADGHIFHRSEGLHGRGYTLCLRCGRADSTSADELSPPSMEQHKRLRGGRDNDREQYCPGNDEGAVKDGLLLGASLYTDVFELQLHDSESGESATRVQAYSIGVVLRRALCRWIGIEEEEIGIHSARARGSVGDRVYSIYLFDTAAGGAGYVAQLARQLDRLLGDAANLLQCHCDKACQSCLLMHDTRYHAELLDRKAALDLMGRRFLDALKLPQALQVFGEKSRLELEPLDLALQRESQHQNIDEIRFHLCGDPTAWEPLLWLDRFDLPRLHRAGTRLTFVAPGATVDGLSESQAAELAAVLSVTEGILWKVAAPSLVDGGLSLILEAGGPRATIRWAATEKTAGTPAVYWGSGAEDARFVIGQFAETLPERIEGAVQVTAEELRKPPAGLTEIVILGDLNGPARTFGDRAWKLIVAHDAFIREKADQKIKISRILYGDRYLLSPLSILLAHALLHGVATGAGVLENGAEVRIVTESITLQDPRRPFRLFHNWHDGQTRRTVFYRLFGGFGGFSLDEREKMRVPHARTLSVQWSDGTEWMLRMDQGVGYWRLGKGEKGSFPFDQDGDVQARFLQKAGLRVMGQSDHFPTYWYSGPRTTS